MEKSKASDPLYFIAIVPPTEIASQITAIKEEMAVEYFSKAALRSPPHITLHMPFRLGDKKLEKLKGVLSEFAKSKSPFEIHLKGFDAFAPRVIFAAVVENSVLEALQDSLLQLMRKEFYVLNGDYKKRAFHPHVTVAFRDLKPRYFKAAWEAYKDRDFSKRFLADNITLLKHDGKKWEVYSNFSLASG